MSHFDADQLWRKQIERRLFELGAAVKGNLPVQADRIADVVEQIAELRAEVRTVTERLDRHAAFLTDLKRERENGSDGT